MLSRTVSDHDDFGSVLHACLELVEDGEESLDTLLSHYPEIQDVLRPPLEAALWLYRKSCSFDPNPAFVVFSRSRLISQVKSELGIPSTGFKYPLTNLSPEIQRWTTRSFLVYLSMVLVLLLIGIRSIGFWIGNSLPGDPLYQIKIFNEQVQLAASFSESRDAQLSIQYVERRMVEAERTILSGRERYLSLAFIQFEVGLNQANRNITTLTQNDVEQGLLQNDELERVLLTQTNKMGTLSGFYPEKYQVFIESIIQIASTNLQH